MSFDHPEFDLLAAFQSRFGLNGNTASDSPPDTRVLSSCEQVARNAIDVFISRVGTQTAAALLHRRIQDKPLSTASWRAHELHPRVKELGEDGCIRFIFTMDLLNFSFWTDGSGSHSDKSSSETFYIEYHDKRWNGYWSLVAGLRRALDEGIPITNPEFWIDEEQCHLDLLKNVFRSGADEELPMLKERLECLREAGTVLCEEFSSSILDLVDQADHSATRFINLLTAHFPCFRDTHSHPDVDERVHFHKRASILAADLWACFDGDIRSPPNGVNGDLTDFSNDTEIHLDGNLDGEDYSSRCTFHDIGNAVTAFADYRVPQMLNALGVIHYSPPLQQKIRERQMLESGGKWEVEIRGCAVWAVELLKREIKALASQPAQEAEMRDNEYAGKTRSPVDINSILLDFYLYDTCKEIEDRANVQGDGTGEAAESTDSRDEKEQAEGDNPFTVVGLQMLPHHRVRSIWY